MPQDFDNPEDNVPFSDQPSVEISDSEFNAASSAPNNEGRINLRLEKALEMEIRSIAEDSRYPLTTVSQVVRFCCLAGMDKLRQWEPRPTLLSSIRAATALAMRDKIQAEAAELLKLMDERIEWYVRHGEMGEAQVLLGDMETYFSQVEESFWRRHILTKLQERMNYWHDRFEAIQRGEYFPEGED